MQKVTFNDRRCEILLVRRKHRTFGREEDLDCYQCLFFYNRSYI